MLFIKLVKFFKEIAIKIASFEDLDMDDAGSKQG